ncbi:MAG TPA: hypothetical protein VFE32_20100 [Puia sp.]|nr:hypothetical protein [Puia sp.]
MNLKAPPLYILSFLMLVFLVYELHDWAHVLAVRVTCHCWPVRTFGDWVLCGSPTTGQHALISIAGPLVNIVLFWAGWSLLDAENSVEEHSLGVALVFAALPLDNLIAAFSGGGDITESLRYVQRHGPTTNHRLVTWMGLVIQLLIILPALIRAFLRLPGYKGKLIAFPLFFLLPGWLDRLWNHQLNKWLIGPETTQWQAYTYVGIWFAVLVICFFLTRRKLKGLIRELSL